MYPPTPQLSGHARKRCIELGVSTRRAKRVVQTRSTTYANTDTNNALVCQSAADPDITVVWDQSRNQIITVLPRIAEPYVRTADGAGYTVIDLRL